MKRPTKFPAAFEPSIRYITNKRTEKEAIPKFEKFLACKLRETQMRKYGAVNEQLVQKGVQEWIEELRKDRFDEGFLDMCKRDYVKLPRQAPRKKVKKKVDANNLPKVTKTALDPQLAAVFRAVKYLSAQAKVRK